MTTFAVNSNTAFRPLQPEDNTDTAIEIVLASDVETGDAQVLELTPVKTAWQNFKENYPKLGNSIAKGPWIQEGEDEEGEVKAKDKSKYIPIGARQTVALGTTATLVAGLSFVFRKEPLIASSLTGTVMGYIKLFYAQLAGRLIPQNLMRAVALVTLVSAVTFHYLPNNTTGILFALNAIPFSDVAMAVFAKCDLAKLKPEAKIVGLLNRCGFEISKKKAKVISTIAQSIIAACLMNPRIFGNFIAAAGAVLSKAHMRRLVDVVWARMSKIKDPATQVKALAVAYSTLILLTVGSVAATYGTDIFTGAASLVPLGIGIITVDTLVRTAKNMIKEYQIPEELEDQQPEPTNCDRALTVVKASALAGLFVGLSAFVGDQMVNASSAIVTATTNPGFSVVICQEAVAFLKVATKKLGHPRIALGITLGLIGIAAVLYLLSDTISITRETPGYGAALFLIPCLINLALYLGHEFIRIKAEKPPKAEKIKTPKVPKLELAPRVELIEENVTDQAVLIPEKKPEN